MQTKSVLELLLASGWLLKDFPFGGALWPLHGCVAAYSGYAIVSQSIVPLPHERDAQMTLLLQLVHLRPERRGACPFSLIAFPVMHMTMCSYSAEWIDHPRLTSSDEGRIPSPFHRFGKLRRRCSCIFSPAGFQYFVAAGVPPGLRFRPG